MEMLEWEDLTLAIANIAWKSRNEVKIIESKDFFFIFSFHVGHVRFCIQTLHLDANNIIAPVSDILTETKK